MVSNGRIPSFEMDENWYPHGPRETQDFSRSQIARLPGHGDDPLGHQSLIGFQLRTSTMAPVEIPPWRCPPCVRGSYGSLVAPKHPVVHDHDWLLKQPLPSFIAREAIFCIDNVHFMTGML